MNAPDGTLWYNKKTKVVQDGDTGMWMDRRDWVIKNPHTLVYHRQYLGKKFIRYIEELTAMPAIEERNEASEFG